jgi:chromosome segregation ATPase
VKWPEVVPLETIDPRDEKIAALEMAVVEHEAKAAEVGIAHAALGRDLMHATAKLSAAQEALAAREAEVAGLHEALAEQQSHASQHAIDREQWIRELTSVQAEREATTAARVELARVAEALTQQQAQFDVEKSQCTAERASLAAAKADLQARIAAIGEEHRKATEVHERARVTAAQYLRKQRSLAFQERQAVEARAAELDAQTLTTREQLKHIEAEKARFTAEASETQARLQQQWAEIQTGRQQYDAARKEWAAKEQALAQRAKDIDAREAAVQPKITAAENRLNDLHAEIAGLESRSTQARQVLADLEAKRESVRPMPSRIAEVIDDWTAPVPLNPQHDHRSANDFLNNLRQQEAEMAKERQKLFHALRNVAAEREAIHDRELRMEEERRRLMSAQQQWQAAETQTVSELEHLAMTLSQREARLQAMEKAWTTAAGMGRNGY